MAGDSLFRAPDLLPRIASAIVMLLLVGVDIWLGGSAFVVFVLVVSAGVYWEWWGLARHLANGVGLALWMLVGAVYIGVSAFALIDLRAMGLAIAGQLLAMVIAVDIGAYFAGRAIGGPKIAPSISPSKTWAGLGGGVFAASLTYAAFMPWNYHDFPPQPGRMVGLSLIAGGGVAVVAQAGDFFESWMKRRAGLKDSGRLIPGHGGLFDRVDGLVAVLFVIACVRAAG